MVLYPEAAYDVREMVLRGIYRSRSVVGAWRRAATFCLQMLGIKITSEKVLDWC
ncbi:MAG: hypothetical protein WA395_05715 [Nitrososphaeraceae archaeon]